jgi:pimeloyl-ACP methyl ester carboxylesterase
MPDTVPPVFRSPEGKARYLETYDAVLREWPVSYDELDVATRLGSTHVIAGGPVAAPPLLLLPSLAASALFWLPNVAALSAHFRTYAVDTIGQTGKSAPTKRIRSRREMADWLNDLMDGLGISRASIVGSSYGGFLALNQAILAPARIDRIVLIGPAASFVGFGWKFYYALFVKGPMRRLIRRWRPRPNRSLPSGMKLEPTGWGKLMATTMRVSARPNLAKAVVFGKRDLKAVRAPVLLLIGEKEILYKPQETIDLAKSRLPGLQGAVIAGAGHLASQSCPGAVNQHILDFLRPS